MRNLKNTQNKFYCENGDELQFNENAARNVLARLYESEISRWLPYQKAKSILPKRPVPIDRKCSSRIPVAGCRTCQQRANYLIQIFMHEIRGIETI
jgi:hypothetical protein